MGYAKKYCPTAPTAPMYYSQNTLKPLTDAGSGSFKKSSTTMTWWR